ncbi:MAG TPA: MgtC/SapB family protein [Sphingomicrobium sp.]|jgi:putative Mg2+ transporter-C (MgtC) family protein
MTDTILGAHDFNLLPHLVALLVAYVLAIPIGWNREREERSAGLRTFPLVALATCGVVQAAENLTADSPEAMARIIEGLITGMGFIGGGAILRQTESVKGTATAASLWVTGAIGAACGLGSYDVALMLAVATVFTLWMMEPLKRLGHLSADERRREGKRGAPRGKKPAED